MSQVPPPPSSGKTALGVAPNVGAMLTYLPPAACCAGLVVSAVVVAREKQNRFLRFHALQSLIVYAASIALSFVFWVLSLIFSQIADVLGFLVMMMLWILLLAVTGIMILLMLKAYQGEEFELPFAGEMARKYL